MAHRIDSAGSTADHLYTSGNPSAGIPPTVVTPEWLNDMQENVCRLIEAADLTLEKGNYEQLRLAIVKMILAGAPSAPSASETVKGIIEIATLLEVLAGEDAVRAVTPAGLLAFFAAKARKRLTADITIYVATTGSDATGDGLTAGTAFATAQKAVNLIFNWYDLNGYKATIQLADGTYTAGAEVNGPFVGAIAISSVVIQGNAGNPANVLVNTPGNCFTGNWNTQFVVKNLKVKSTSWAGLSSTNYSNIGFSNIVFDTCGQGHIVANGAKIQALGNYSIVGGAPYHVLEDQGGKVYLSGATVTISGTPAFSQAFITLNNVSFIYATGMNFGGTGATGIRYNVTGSSVINTGGGGASYLPGSIAGTYSSGGQYV